MDPFSTCELGTCDDGLDEATMESIEVSLLQTGTQLHEKLQDSKSAAAEGAHVAGVEEAPGNSVLAVINKAAEAQKVQMKAVKSTKADPAPASAGPRVTVPVVNGDFVISGVVFIVVLLVAYEFYSKFDIGPLAWASPLLAEFVGTFVLVFTIGCCSVPKLVAEAWVPTVIGFVLMALVYATAPISGGNLNPAVTLSLGLTGKLDWGTVWQYWGAQLLAGVSAGFCATCLFPTLTATVGPVEPFSWQWAGIVELFYTAMLCFVVLNCAASRKNNSQDDSNQFFGLAIGLVIIAGGYPSGAISGANFNPAVSFGYEMLSSTCCFHGIIWIMWQLLGSIIAVALFWLVRPAESSRSPDEDDKIALQGAACVAEAIGTFVLVFTVGLNVIMESTAVAWSAAAALLCMVYSLGDVSGAHLNPAVTLAVLFSGRGKCSFPQAFMNVSGQIIGTACAAGLYTLLQLAGSKKEFPLAVGDTYTPSQACDGELVFTSLLAYVVLAVATTSPPASQASSRNFYFGLCIGACVLVGGTCVGSISGGQLNPAVTLGRSLSSWMYNTTKGGPSLLQQGKVGLQAAQTLAATRLIINELLGGLLAAGVFRFTHACEFRSDFAVKLSDKICAEFVGTFYLVFTVGCCIVAGSDTWNSFVIGLVLMVMVYSTAFVSGGNLNPAVSFCLALCRKLEVVNMSCYWLAQFLASACAVALLGPPMFSGAANVKNASLLKDGYSWSQAMSAEMIYTVMLCLVVTNCVCSRRNNSPDDGNQFFGLAIGLVIVAGGYAVGSISGACFNPAVSVALDVFSTSFAKAGTSPRTSELCVTKWGAEFCVPKWGAAWSLAQCFGGLIATFIVAALRHTDDVAVPAQDGDQHVQHFSLGRRCLSESLGTFFVVLTFGLNLVTGSPALALSAGAALGAMMYTFNDISGAHFNPAVTLAACLGGRGKISKFDSFAYVAWQFIAATIAAHAYGAFYLAGPNKASKYLLEPGKDYGFLKSGIMEMFFTALIAYVFLATATIGAPGSQRSRRNAFFGLAIAACVIAGGFAIGVVSGGEFNPAVCLGISMANLISNETEKKEPTNFFPFALWELAGGILAAMIFNITHAHEYEGSSKPAQPVQAQRPASQSTALYPAFLPAPASPSKSPSSQQPVKSVSNAAVASTGGRPAAQKLLTAHSPAFTSSRSSCPAVQAVHNAEAASHGGRPASMPTTMPSATPMAMAPATIVEGGVVGRVGGSTGATYARSTVVGGQMPTAPVGGGETMIRSWS